jgi:hypothetical protein
MKLRMRTKAQIAGYVFGKICFGFGAFFALMFMFLIPNTNQNTDTLINAKFIIPAIISALTMIYGMWRIGGVD